MTFQQFALKNIVAIRIGYQSRTGIENQPHGKYRIIQPRDFLDDLSLNIKSVFTIDINSSPCKYIVCDGDVLFFSRGAKNSAVVLQKIPNDTVASGLFYILRPVREIILPEYLAMYINLPQVQASFSAHSQGTGIHLVTRAMLEKTQIPVPSVDIQKKLAYVSGLIKKEHDLNNKISEKREKLIQAICLGSVKNKGAVKS